jgi:hypothetical protein
MTLARDLLAQRCQDARLADTGLARYQHDLALAVYGAAPAFDQKRDFGVASDEGSECLGTRRVETADDFLLAQDKPGP